MMLRDCVFIIISFWCKCDRQLRDFRLDVLQDWTKMIGISCNTFRMLETAVNRFFIGHTQATHNYLLLRRPPLHCIDCNIQLTIRHLTQECPTYRPFQIWHQRFVYISTWSEFLIAIASCGKKMTYVPCLNGFNDYFFTLKDTTQNRYVEKIKLIK